jgi:hypothetical protein
MGGYFRATRHPWPCLLFLLPLLGAYEGGLFWLGGSHPDALRNGADTWLHWGLETFGLSQLYWAPACVIIFFFAWSLLRRWDQPRDSVSVCAGMALESVAFAFGLWALSRQLNPFLKSMGVMLQAPRPLSHQEMLAHAITFVGAGIYEEILFRLLLFGGLVWLLRNVGLLSPITLLVVALGSAGIFSAAHYAGPFGEPFSAYSFLFRAIAGLYFALLFQIRGFGIAVGAHACYDVLVGIVMA